MEATTIEEKKHIGDVHFEYRLWANALKFYKEELKIFNHRLEEVVIKNTNNDFEANAEHFQNQFILQGEVIDILAHDMKERDYELIEQAEMGSDRLEFKYLEAYKEIKDRMVIFEKIWKELRKEYFNFLVRWM